MNFRKYFFEITLTSYFQKFNLSKISRYTVIGLVTFQRYRYALYNTRYYPLTTQEYPRMLGMTTPLQ